MVQHKSETFAYLILVEMTKSRKRSEEKNPV